MRRLAGVLADALCALTGHPEALGRKNMGVLRREVREMLASGEVSAVAVRCICGRKMKTVNPEWAEPDGPVYSPAERLAAWLVVVSIILVIAGVRL